MSVVLIGLPASGKTTVGAALATVLGLSFIDTDVLIEERTGSLVREIFADQGEDHFRQLEQVAAADALASGGVVSLGGGAIMTEAIRAMLPGHQVVWLDVSVVTLTRRAGMNRLRPLLLTDVRAQMSALAAKRLPVYERTATWRVDAEQPVDDIVAQIMDHLASAAVVTVRVEADQPYDVLIGRGVASKLVERLEGVARIAILHPPVLHDRAAAMAAKLPGAMLIEAPAGEAAKTTTVLDHCWRALAQAGFTRSDAVVGLGGGTTTDLAGFVAATMLRGLPYFSLPTTVLAMADAAVGGKTGVNLPEGKNLVGAFWEPRAVACDLDFLGDLPSAEVASGLGEIIKCGFIADSEILDLARLDPQALTNTSTPAFAEALTRAIQVKTAVVSQDLREQAKAGQVGREALNYGHTLAHAIEKVEGFTWAHGAAVAVGMVFAAEVARRLGLLNDDEVALHREVLASVGLPVSYHASDWSQLRSVMSVDKKARGNHLRLVLLEGIGHPTALADIPEDLLADSYAAIG
ncbi:MAG: 3-dehydroquinate synthase [Propionibacteriaceae bacterium]|nr:3-dehydroquinate synthase [Propionibacteriaceae bacterium]